MDGEAERLRQASTYTSMLKTESLSIGLTLNIHFTFLGPEMVKVGDRFLY